MSQQQRMNRRRFLALAGAGAATAGFLAACGGSGGASIAPSGAASARTSSAGAASRSAVRSAAASGSAAASAAGAIPTIPAGKPETIVVGSGVPVASFAPIWLALDQGYFKKHGLEATLQQLEGVTQAQAIVAGQVQVGSVGEAEVLDSRAGGADLIVIRITTEFPVFAIHADPSIKTVDDLKGKTIGITRAGSTTDIATRADLVKHGLKPDTDVKLLAASNPAGIIAAMQKGDIQAGMLAPPATEAAAKAGFPQLVSLLKEQIPLPLGSVVTTKKYAGEHPEGVYAFLEAESEGLRDFFNSPDVTVKTIAKYTKSDQAAAKNAYDTYVPAVDPVGLVTKPGFTTVQKYGKNAKARQVNVADAYDNHFLHTLVSSGFIKGLGIKRA